MSNAEVLALLAQHKMLGSAPAAEHEWLAAHGTEYGFELSFPDGNTQGVAYEPWHWRFVGTPEAMETFRWARQLFPASPAVIGP